MFLHLLYSPMKLVISLVFRKCTKRDPVGHSNSGPMVCMMQNYEHERAEEFYDLIRKNIYDNITDENIIDAFCDVCWGMLIDNVDLS